MEVLGLGIMALSAIGLAAWCPRLKPAALVLLVAVCQELML